MPFLGSIFGAGAAAALKYVAIGAAFALLFLVAQHYMNAHDAAIREAGAASAQRDQAIAAANDTAAAWAQARADAAHNAVVAAEARAGIAASNQAVATLRVRLAAMAAQPGGDAPMTPALKNALDAWRAAVRGEETPAAAPAVRPAAPHDATPMAVDPRRMPGGPAVFPPAGWLDYCLRNRGVDAGCPAVP